MDIEKTTESLKEILEYKKEISKEMLKCSDEKTINNFAEIISYTDIMIKKILGMYDV